MDRQRISKLRHVITLLRKILSNDLMPVYPRASLYKRILFLIISIIKVILGKGSLWEEYLRLSKIWLVRSFDGFLFLIRNSPVDLDIVDLTHEAEVAPVILKALRTSKVFIDVGAHVGAYAIRAYSIMGRGGIVVAVECNPISFALLKLNFEINYGSVSGVYLINSCASNIDGEQMLVEPIDVPSGSFLLLERLRKLRDVRTRIYRVKTTTLDSIVEELDIDRVDLVKIDVEGHEVYVLLGAEKLLQKTPRIVVEVRSENTQLVDNIMLSHGFSLCDEFHNGFYRIYCRNGFV